MKLLNEENVIADDPNEAVVDIYSDNEEGYLMGTFYKSHSQTQPEYQPLIPQTPLQAEFARSMNNRDAADQPNKGTPSFVVLGWWYLAIQAASCASEMTLSTGGATVTTQRTKLNPANVNYLVYCKQNLPKIKLVRPRLE